jgi:hypothetical protein
LRNDLDDVAQIRNPNPFPLCLTLEQPRLTLRLVAALGQVLAGLVDEI